MISDGLRDNLLARMQILKLSRRALSLRAGLSEGAVKAILAGHSKHPRHDTLEKIAAALACTVSELLGLGKDEGASVLHRVPVRGEVRAGAWVEAFEWPRTDWFEVAVPADTRYPALPRFGLVARGPSMDLIYPDGTVLICIAFADLGRDPRTGERVICRRRRPGGEYEITVKEYVVRDGAHWLLPKSTDPEFQSPVKLEPGRDGEVGVIALVVGSYHRVIR